MLAYGQRVTRALALHTRCTFPHNRTAERLSSSCEVCFTEMGYALEQVRVSQELNSAEPFPLLDGDAVRWHYPNSTQIVAIGDLHGDLAAFAALCREVNLVDSAGHWIGRDTHLVLLGDLVGGHKDSRFLLDMVMRLVKEALAQGGRVHALLGNQDVLPIQGQLYGMTGKEKKRYQDFPLPGDAFRGNTCYAEWLRTRNSILRIGEWLFAHAGLDTWALTTEPGRINATVRAWVRYWQTTGPRPPAETRWVVAAEDWTRRCKVHPGPLWNRSLKVKVIDRRYQHCPNGSFLPPHALEAALARWQTRRLIVGHSPVEGGEILLRHPLYKEKVVMIDTSISAVNGTLSALCINGDAAVPRYVKDRQAGLAIRTRQKKIASQT
jgi:hypothetical protein